jgi:hypothetical protein
MSETLTIELPETLYRQFHVSWSWSSNRQML